MNLHTLNQDSLSSALGSSLFVGFQPTIDTTSGGTYCRYIFKEQSNSWVSRSFIREIQELSKLKANWNSYDAKEINPESISNCIKFIKLFKEQSNHDLLTPFIDPHPDGEVSLTWRSQSIGILNISFSNDGMISFACLFTKDNGTYKGKVSSKDDMDPALLKLIEEFHK